MKKKLLAMAVTAAVGAALCGITADAAVYQLDEIIVNGDKYTDDTIMPGGQDGPPYPLRPVWEYGSHGRSGQYCFLYRKDD